MMMTAIAIEMAQGARAALGCALPLGDAPSHVL